MAQRLTEEKLDLGSTLSEILSSKNRGTEASVAVHAALARPLESGCLGWICTIVSGCVVLVRAPFLIVGRIALVRRTDLFAIIDDFIDLAAFGRVLVHWEGQAVLTVCPVVLQVFIGRLLQILGLWVEAFPRDQ